MQEQDIRAALTDFELRVNVGKDRAGNVLYFAHYAEVPGCLVEAPTREAALTELDTLICPFIGGILEDGGSMPVALRFRRRVQGQTLIFESLSVGSSPARKSPWTTSDAKTGVDEAPRFVKREASELVEV